VLLPTLVALLAACGSDGDQPNIVLVVVGGLRADHLGCYGYARPTSPNIDTWSKSALRYSRALTPTPGSVGALAAMFTSRFPHELGLSAETPRLPSAVPTLAERLSQEGYETIGVVDREDIGRRAGFQRGFASFAEPAARPPNGGVAPPAPVTTRALDAVQRRVSDSPLFLWVHYADPEMPYQRRDENRFEFSYNGPLPANVDAEALRNAKPFNLEDRAWTIGAYDSEIAHVDAEIGRLLDGLRKAQLLRDAVVVITSTHGQEFMEHQGYGHGHTLYREAIHVPLLIGDSRAPASGSVERPVSLIDLMPTLLARVGAAPSPEFRGAPLHSDSAERAVFSETTQTGWPLRSVVHDGFKTLFRAGTGTIELYYFDSDPHDEIDVSKRKREKERADAGRQQVERWWNATQPAAARADRSAHP
jgi:arylsulfatase